VLAQTFAFEDAVEWIRTYRDDPIIDATVRQTALLLEGVSHKALEEFDEARTTFEESVMIDPDSEVGVAAAGMLADLQ